MLWWVFDFFLRLIFCSDLSLLGITPLEAHIQSSRLKIDKKYATMEAFNIDFKDGKAVNVDFGSISMDHGSLFEVFRVQVMLDGDSLKLAVVCEAKPIWSLIDQKVLKSINKDNTNGVLKKTRISSRIRSWEGWELLL
ncbi:hypothetical protein L596_001894 [Steinernema carpocapsae]|uniref:Uncharacterized protein n=1 Tax=Steinernema carpocapsae TaxID=34508 RepID=A0A4U8UMX3_STECR|nr:hypothetical protein L596_001894 [Steinernema carpocapsae]